VTPYYDDGSVSIFHGDCRDVLPTLSGPFDVLLTEQEVEMTEADAVRALESINVDDPELAHQTADGVILRMAPISVQEAYQQLIARAPGWWYA
jgi:hypothetical protein